MVNLEKSQILSQTIEVTCKLSADKQKFPLEQSFKISKYGGKDYFLVIHMVCLPDVLHVNLIPSVYLPLTLTLISDCHL